MKKVVLVIREGDNSLYLYNSIKEYVKVVRIIIEAKEKRSKFIKRKIRIHGLFHAIGQLIFLLIVPKLLRYSSNSRIKQIEDDFKLSKNKIPESMISHVDSINDPSSSELLMSFKPDIVVINGCSILGKRILDYVDFKILNIHVGITPMYRGVHGGFWAAVNKDYQNLGVTLHYINQGIDTGEIVSQRKIEISRADNYTTLPILQYANGLVLLKKFLKNDEKECVETTKKFSRVWYHPSLFEYFKSLIRRG